MKKYVNGEYLDLTEEELEAIKNIPKEPVILSMEDRMEEVEKNTVALKIMLGVD